MASFFVLVILSLATFFVCRADLISEVCNKSTNPTLCTETLGSDPSALKADLKGLGQIVVMKAITATQDVLAISKSKSGPPASTCEETSGDAISILKECVDYLKSSSRSSIRDLQIKGSAAFTYVDTCDDEFKSSEPADLKAATKKAKDIIDVLLVIANKLRGFN